MGFDIECIIDIHTYPGEYFCPVCRTLVYPNDAFQSQCTHLYCKPCLAHIANSSRTCPYDGYLVTESDSKPLVDSDKALSENISKVKVHCLYFRSGCTWEGTLSDCTSHCLGCSFGNSPVICNKCSIQIVHRQVHDHAQSCPGVHGLGGLSSLPKSGTVSSTAEVSQAAALSGAPPSQAQNPPSVTATPLPGQSVTSQASAPPQAPVVEPTHEQMYQQQQYQQYYQQYAPYQQSNQQCYAVQQYQQHPPQVVGQQQYHSYSQPQQPNPLPQAPQQPHIPQGRGKAPSQPQTTLTQLPVPPQGQAPMQALVPNYQVSSQQQAYPPMRPQTQTPQQALPPPPQIQPTLPQPYSQAMGVRPPAQYLQVPQYQQPHVKMHHPQFSQSNAQPQIQSQAPQSSNQLQPQPYHTNPHHPVFPQANQSASSFPQAPQHPAPAVGGHHSYPHSQPPQKMHPGASHQHPVHPQVASGALHPVQVHGEVPQHALMRPPSHGSMPHQHTSTLLAPQNQMPGINPAPHQLFQSHAPPPPAYPQHRPVMALAQQALPQNYAQQQNLHAPSQGQLHQQGHLSLQQSVQTQSRLPGPPQSLNFSGRPMMPNQGIHSQSHSFLSGTCAPAHSGPVQSVSAQPSAHKDNAESTVLEQKPTVQETKSLSKNLAEKVGEPLNEGVVSAVKDEDINGNVNKPIIMQGENRVQGATEQASGVNSFEGGAAKDEFQEDGKLLTHSDSLKQVDLDNEKLKSKTVVTGPPSNNIDKQFHTVVSSSDAEGHILIPHSHGSHQQMLQGPGIPPHPEAHKSTEERAIGCFGTQGPALISTDPHGIMEKPPLRFEGSQHVGRSSEILMSNNQISSSAHLSGEGGPFSGTNADELSTNGLAAAELSNPVSRDEKKSLPRELLNPFPREPVRNSGQVSSSLDRAASHGPISDPMCNLYPSSIGPHSRFFPHRPSGAHGHADVLGSGSEFGQPNINHSSCRSPYGDYCGSPRRFGAPSSFPLGTSAVGFGDGSHPPSDPAGNPFRDGRFPTMADHVQSGNLSGPRFGDHMVPVLHQNVIGSDNVFGKGHLIRGYFPSREPGVRGRAGEFSGPGNFPRLPFSESIRSERLNFAHFGESPVMNYSHHGFHTAGNISGVMDSFDQSGKRKPASYGWCRICEIDCGSVEGLDVHSQTREHQKMAMDIVKSIKMQNKIQQRTSAGHMLSEGGSMSRKLSIGGRGS